MYLRVTFALQNLRRTGARMLAGSSTVGDDGAVARNLCHARFDVAERDVVCAADFGVVAAAHVYDVGRVGARQQRLELGERDARHVVLRSGDAGRRAGRDERREQAERIKLLSHASVAPVRV